jgi:SAP domain-containing new25/Domain of unknown function (DUF6434)
MRPSLDRRLSAESFAQWYWLKEELVVFCRDSGITTSGSKPELTQRVIAFLNGASLPPSIKIRRRGNMPDVFSLSTVIGKGWRCNPALGQFFRSHCGNGFRFNAAMRNFIHSEVGRTLEEAMHCYRASVSPSALKQEIIAQNEYNRHTREFFRQNPGASREEVLAAWWEKRNRQK